MVVFLQAPPPPLAPGLTDPGSLIWPTPRTQGPTELQWGPDREAVHRLKASLPSLTTVPTTATYRGPTAAGNYAAQSLNSALPCQGGRYGGEGHTW